MRQLSAWSELYVQKQPRQITQTLSKHKYVTNNDIWKGVWLRTAKTLIVRDLQGFPIFLTI